MRSRGSQGTLPIVAAALLSAAVLAAAQDRSTSPPPPAARSDDPRVGLKPGFDDPGVAAWNLELVGHIDKPDGFQDSSGGLSFANSDIAFQNMHLFLGNFHGFNFYNVEDPRRPKLQVSVPCPGGQGDLSVYKNLLFMSVEQTRGRVDCGTQGISEPVSAERFRGVRIFDITDMLNPKQIAAVQTCRGSHTHTLVVDPDDKEHIYIYGSGASSVRSAEELAGCSGGDPKENPETALFSIDVIQVNLAAPQDARIVNRPRIFADPDTGAIAGLWPGGAHGEGTQRTSTTNQCHDITVYPELGLGAGACSGNGILLDISDPVHPVRLDAVIDTNFAYWHSATFNNDGTKVIFTDEWGGGTQPRCRATDSPTWGANAVFDIGPDRKLTFGGYFKMPAPQTDLENCVAHNGSIVPVPGRDIMVQAWYQGGVSVFDFTDSTKPVEIAFFDRGPATTDKIIVAGYWSTYWYNGFIYGSEIARGLDIFRLKPSALLSEHEIAAANLVRMNEFNAQQQPRLTWPAHVAVGRAYYDQLTRDKAIDNRLASAVKSALDRAERLPDSGRNRDAAVDQLTKAAAELEQAANAVADGLQPARMRKLAETMKGIAGAR